MKRLFRVLVASFVLGSLAFSQTIEVQSFTPTSGTVGDTITLGGVGFSATASKNIVRFGGVKALVISASGGSSIMTRVPLGASYGYITVTDTSAGVTGSSWMPFPVTFPAQRAIDQTFLGAKVDFSVSPGTSPKGVAVGDIDGDGKADVIVALKESRKISIHRNLSSSGSIVGSSFDTPVQDTVGTSSSKPYAVALGDLDGDGDLDIAVTDSAGSSVFVWVNASTPGSVAKSNILTLTVGTNPCGIAIGDLNGDGRPEIVTANKGSGNVSVLKDTVSGGALAFLAAKNYAVGTAPVDVKIGDMSNDGSYEPDIIVTNSSGNNVTILQNQAYPFVTFGTTVYAPTNLNVGTTPTGLVIADFDGDGLNDIATSNSGATTVSVLRNTSGFGTSLVFNSKVDFSVGTSPFDIAVSDLNGDGKPELSVIRKSVDSLTILQNATTSGIINSSSFASAVSYPAGSSPSGIVIGDLDRDTKADVVVTNAGGNSFSAFRNKAKKSESESNNTATAANRILIGETIDGTIQPNTDVDYFKFFAVANDTVEIFVNTRNGSGLRGAIEVIDSAGNYLAINNWFNRNSWPSDTAIHNIIPISQTGTYFVRYNYIYGGGYSFPNSAPPTKRPVPTTTQNTSGPSAMPSSAAGTTATGDTGAYRLRLERFTPSAPDVQYYGGYWNSDYNFGRIQGQMAPNGASTSLSFEYGLSPSSLPNSVTGQPPTVNGITISYVQGDLNGLTPNTTYYYRLKAANSFGTSYSDPNYGYFTTPAAPEGWVFQQTGGETEFYGSSFISATTGWIVGAGGVEQIFSTTDGGNNWAAQNNPTGWALYGVNFRNSLNGISVGDYGTIIKTTDGGATWTDQSNASYRGWTYAMYAVRYFSTTTAIAVGADGTIMRSSDSWNTWTLVRHGASTLNAISIVSSLIAYAVGENGTILRTTDAGVSWDSLASGTASHLQTVYFFNQSTGFVAGSNYVLRKTTNGGVTWTNVALPQTQNDPYYLFGISFSDANNGVLVGSSGAILRTTNGGATWTRQKSGTFRYIYAASFYGRSATVVGERGLVLNYLDPTDEVESNDNAASANLIAYRDAVDARIDPGDQDYFQFAASAADTVVVFVESRDTAVVNGTLQLLNTDGTTILESNDDFVPGDSVRSRVVKILPAPGTYFIRYAGNSSSASGNYRISLNKTALGPLVPFGGVATILTTTNVILKSPVVPNNLTTVVSFQYGPDASYGTTVPAEVDTISGQQLVTATKTLGGLTPFQEYHFRVKAQNNAGIAYGPDVTFLTALGMLRAETEPNNVSSAATTIFVGDTVQGTLLTDTDIDYFRFQAAAGDTLEIFVEPRNGSNLESRIEVVDSSGGLNQIVSNGNMPDSRGLHAAFIATNTGVYHIRQSYTSNWNTYYPSEAATKSLPQMSGPPLVPSSTISSSGDYELRFRRFLPAAPDVRKYPWADATFSTAALIHVDVASNGRPTDVFVEYGTTQSLGSSIQYAAGPVTTIGYQYWFRIPIFGLTPSTVYYFRLKAVNDLGTSYSEIGTFKTGPVSEKWDLKVSGTSRTLGDVSSVGDSLAIVLAEGSMLRTTNAGATWVDISLPRYPYAVAFKDADTALAMGWSIVRSANKGATWQFIQDLPSNTYAQKVRFLNSQIGAGAGAYYSQSAGQYLGGIARTLDGGATWETKGGFSNDLVDLSFVSADTLRAISYNGWLYRTNNFTASSPTWDSVQVVNNEETRAVNFVTADIGVVGGGRISRTTDGGTTWTQVVPPYIYIRDIAMKNAQVGVAVGGNGQIYRTTDAGASWVQEVSGTNSWLAAASYSGRTAIAVGDAGTILYSVDPLGEQEPNNTSGTATPFAIGEQAQATIDPAGDLDFYSFSAAANDTIEILLTGTGVNTALQLIGIDGATVLTQNDNFAPGDTTSDRLVYVITGPGTYFIRVAGSTAGSTGGYLLKLQRTNLKPTIVSASVIATPTSASVTGLVVPNNLVTSAQVEWDTSTAYAKTPVPVNEGTFGGQQQKTVTATISGLTENKDYYFRLVATNGAGTTIGVDVPFHTPRAAALSEVAQNDSASMAQEIAFGDSINGAIRPINDVDYYMMHVLATDTLEIFASRRGDSQLRGRVGLIDSAQQYYYDNNDWFPTDSSTHSVTNFSNATTLYIRYNYSYNYNSSFPGSRDTDGILPLPAIAPSGAFQTVTEDTGQYRLYVRRFVRSAPEGQDFVGYRSAFSDAMSFQTTIASNGLPTTVSFQYGTTPQNYGSLLPSANGPFNNIYREGAYSSLTTGLQPNTSYYVRTVLTNSAGTAYGGGKAISTPLAPEGWSRINTGTEMLIWDAEFPADLVGYVVGSGGYVAATTDGGTTWISQTSGVGATLRGVSFISQSIGMAAGNSGVVLKTTNGGTNWVQLTSPTTAPLFSVKMLSSTEALAVGYNGTIIRSTDAGASWDTVRTGTESFRSLSFEPSGTTGYAVGFAASGGPLILRTTNRGASWSTAPTPATGGDLTSVWFHDANRGVVGGSATTFFHTTNGGTTWTQIQPPSGSGYYIYSIAFADTSNGVAVADNGGIYRTYDGGKTWSSQSSGTFNTLVGAFMRGRSAYALGSYGTLLRAVGLLATPTSLTATYSGSSSVGLTWNDASTNESGYWVERKTGTGGTYAVVNTTTGNATSYTDNVTRGAIYFYRARAFITGTDTSAYSNEDSAFVPLNTPTALNATAVGAARIDLAWSASADARSGFKVERATSASGPFTQVATPAAGATSYSDMSPSSGTRYYYRIRSYNADMQSEYSNIDSALTALGKPQSITANPSTVTNGSITISWSGPSGATHAWYNVDATPTLSAPSVQVALSGNSFVISNPPTGSRWIYVALQNSESVTDVAAYDSVETKYDNVAPQITDQTVLPTITITGTNVSDPASLSFTVNVVKPSGIASLQNPVLQYKKTNSNTITSTQFPSISGGTVNVGSLSSLFLTIGKPNGVEYRITASDAAGNIAATTWRSFTVFVSAPPVSDFVPPAAGTSDDISTLITNYRLFSVPYELADKKPGTFMETVDKGLGPHVKDGVNYYFWRMQRYVNGSYQDYEDFKNQDVLTPGAAFFILSREQKTVTVGSGNLVKAQDMYNNGIQVVLGWNLVGNPFPDDFPADSMFVLAGSIANKAYYDGTGPDGGWWKSGTQIQTLKRWEGLAINVTQSTTLRFKALPQASEQTGPTPAPLSAQQAIKEKQEGGWLMRFDAHRSGSAVVDVGNMIGEAPEAGEGYDAYDSFQPPLLPGKSLAVYFKNPDGAMSADIRPIETSGSSWEMKVVTGDRGARVKLDVSEVVPVPDAAFETYMLDIDDHMAYDLKERQNVEFGSKEGVRNFRVLVGSKAFVDSVSTSLGIDLVPQVFMLYQNYPNPFNPETALRFWLPGTAPSYKVTLKVYNIIGQEVSTMIDRDMKAGYYETTFTGRNLASGTYIYRLTVNGGTKETTFSSVKKMVMVK